MYIYKYIYIYIYIYVYNGRLAAVAPSRPPMVWSLEACLPPLFPPPSAAAAAAAAAEIGGYVGR